MKSIFDFPRRKLDLIFIELVSPITILIAWECRNYSQFWKLSSITLVYLHIYRLDIFHQKLPSTNRLSWINIGSNPDFALKNWNWISQKSLFSNNLDSSWFSNSVFSPKTRVWVPSLRSHSLVSYFLLLYLNREITSHPISGILSNQKWRKVLLVLTHHADEDLKSSTLPASFSYQRVNR